MNKKRSTFRFETHPEKGRSNPLGEARADDLLLRVAFGIGVVFLVGVLLTIWHLLTLKPLATGAAE